MALAVVEKEAPSSLVPLGDQSVLLRGIPWSTYIELREIRGSHHVRMTYNRGDLELTSPSRRHDRHKSYLGSFAEIVADCLDVELDPAGSTTWYRPEAERAVEADECYYFDAEKLKVLDQVEDAVIQSSGPYPDLVIEIDLSPNRVDRPTIYASLGVAEIWRFDGSRMHIDQLVPDGTYRAAAESRFLPVQPADLDRWLEAARTIRMTAWTRRVREWARTELAERLRGRDKT